MKTLFIFVIGFCLVIFNQSCSGVSYKPSEKEKFADFVLAKAALKIKKDKDLHPSGFGGQMLHEIKMLALSFKYYKSISIEQARVLIVESVNEFVDIINQDERIRPYLYNYPFEAKNVEIRIFIRNPDGSFITPGKLSIVSSINGTLEYDTRDPKTTRLKTMHKETFEEALEKIKASKEVD